MKIKVQATVRLGDLIGRKAWIINGQTGLPEQHQIESIGFDRFVQCVNFKDHHPVPFDQVFMTKAECLEFCRETASDLSITKQ